MITLEEVREIAEWNGIGLDIAIDGCINCGTYGIPVSDLKGINGSWYCPVCSDEKSNLLLNSKT